RRKGCRCSYPRRPPSERAVEHYRIHINSSAEEQAASAPKTGSLYRARLSPGPPPPPLQTALDASIKTGEWFSLEVIVSGNRVRVLVNRKLVVDYTDTAPVPRQGRIMLAKRDLTTVAKFRKVEIK